MYTRTTTTTFDEVKQSATRSGTCACGRKAKKTMAAVQTINPYNKDEHGVPKTRAQIVKENLAKLAEWRKTPFKCAQCDDRRCDDRRWL